MSPQASGASQGVIIFIAVIILIVARRIYRNVTGVKASHARIVGWTVFYFVFSGFIISTSFLEGVPLYYAALDVGALAAGAYISHRVSRGRLKFWKRDGGVYYTGGIVIYLVYVVGLVLRLGIEYAFVGPSAFAFAPISGITQTAVLGLAAADSLFSFGYGLLVGRNIRVYSDLSRVSGGEVALLSEQESSPAGTST